MSTNNVYRLTNEIRPINYHVTLTPDFDNWTFTGSEIIELNIENSNTNTITLNSADIVINSARYNNGLSISLSEVGRVEYDLEMERTVITFENQFLAGEGFLYLEFTGILNEDLRGFYRSIYKNDNNEDVKMAVTQFAASDARRAFPCWDEPIFKATFDVTLIVPKSMVALSNMPEKCRTVVDENFMKVDFDRTPIMSTYLLAFVIGYMDFVESFDSNGVKVRVYTATDKAERGRFALDVCCKTLPFYANYFGIEYPLPKMDLVAVHDFAFGAMENWGLVTYREAALLVDEHESSAGNRQNVALTVGHECAHMWFGNLVTMEWWTDLWLNEGFATWVEYLCVDHCYPEFNIWTNFVSNEYARALTLDSLKSSHPIQVTVNKPCEINEIFDAISYSKGASIIRMLNEYLGNEKFKAGLNIYLHRHKYGNAVTADLWQALSDASGISVAAIMDTWTTQTGFPVVSVECSHDSHGNTVSVTLQQQRFLANNDSTTPDDSFWLVPVTICSLTEPNKPLLSVLMARNGDKQTFVLPTPVSSHGVVINSGAIGFYHVRYQETLMPSLIDALTNNTLSPRHRLALAMDSFALARSGDTSIISALDICQGYKTEDNFTVWTGLLNDLAQIASLVSEFDSSLSDNVTRFLVQLVQPTYETLGWDARSDESQNEKMLRPIIIRTLGSAGYNAVIKEANKRFEDHFQRLCVDANQGALMPADIRGPVYSTVLKHGNETHLNKVMEILKKIELHEERLRLLTSLGSVNIDQLSHIHRFVLSDQVRKQDKVQVLQGTVTSSRSRAALWHFMTTNWAEFHGQISNGRMLGMIIKAAFSGFATASQLDALDKFFIDNMTDAKMAIDQTLENIKVNIALLDRDQEKLKKFFDKY